MSLLIYNIFLFTYNLGIKIASIWNTKATLWVAGRRNWKKTITPTNVWIHCASLGEFEQGRPIIEALKKEDPSLKIAVSFFSPSGYEVVKNYSGADQVFYLPIDSAANAKKLIDTLNPSLVLWVKYEYWYYYLATLKQRKIPTLLISGIFLPSQPFFKWYGIFWKNILSSFTHFFVQNKESEVLLNSINFTKNITISGDTRFDRVIAIAEKWQPIELIEIFCKDKKTIVAGSTWEDDEEELVHFVRNNVSIQFIIAPHNINAENIKDVKNIFKGAILYSELTKENICSVMASTNVLIIDNIGMLSTLYKYATIAYIGGGFTNDGIHNVLEASVYGKPIVFGPNYEKYVEAIGLIDNGGAISIDNALELEQIFNQLLNNEALLKKQGDTAKNYTYSNAGATSKIIAQSLILLKNND